MEREHSKDGFKEKKHGSKTHSEPLKHETGSAGQTAKDNALKIGGGVAGAAGLLALVKSFGSSSSGDDALRRPLSDTYAQQLTADLERRLADDVSFPDALIATLRSEAPVTLYDPTASTSSTDSSVLKTLLTLGALAAAGYGLNLLAKQQTGKGAATLAQEQFGQQRSSPSSEARPGTRRPTEAAAVGVYGEPPAPYAALEDDFRTHHRSAFGEETGHSYDEAEPAYRHGLEYAAREERQAHDYEALEPEIRQTYEERHGKGSFGPVGEAARHAFERGRARHTASGDPSSAMREDLSDKDASSS